MFHISEISEKYIKHPSEALSVGDIVRVKVIAIDLDKNGICDTTDYLKFKGILLG